MFFPRYVADAAGAIAAALVQSQNIAPATAPVRRSSPITTPPPPPPPPPPADGEEEEEEEEEEDDGGHGVDGSDSTSGRRVQGRRQQLVKIDPHAPIGRWSWNSKQLEFVDSVRVMRRRRKSLLAQGVDSSSESLQEWHDLIRSLDKALQTAVAEAAVEEEKAAAAAAAAATAAEEEVAATAAIARAAAIAAAEEEARAQVRAQVQRQQQAALAAAPAAASAASAAAPASGNATLSGTDEAALEKQIEGLWEVLSLFKADKLAARLLATEDELRATKDELATSERKVGILTEKIEKRTQ